MTNWRETDVSSEKIQKVVFKSEIEMTEHGGIFEKIAVAPVNRLAGATQYEARIKQLPYALSFHARGQSPFAR